MKKRPLLLITVLIVALLCTLSLSAHAGPPIAASGTWWYIPTIVDTRLAGNNMFLEVTSVDYWTGTFDSPEGGGSNSVYGAAIHEFVSLTETGSWYGEGLSTFVGTVAGKSGTLVIRFVGRRPGATADWSGTWVILRGTDELKNLRGQGTWWGPGWQGDPDVYGQVDYSGNIHFEPQ
jgi:hypothetical protein